MPHQSYVVSHSRNAGIDPAWAYGLMRQESRFVTSARSMSDAGGLMQIMPDTAKLVARQMGESYNPAALTDMNTNIRYGTYYLSMIQRQLSNSPVLATAGYNRRSKSCTSLAARIPSDCSGSIYGINSA